MFAQRFVTLFVKRKTTPYNKNVNVTQNKQQSKTQSLIQNDKNIGDWYEVSFR